VGVGALMRGEGGCLLGIYLLLNNYARFMYRALNTRLPISALPFPPILPTPHNPPSSLFPLPSSPSAKTPPTYLPPSPISLPIPSTSTASTVSRSLPLPAQLCTISKLLTVFTICCFFFFFFCFFFFFFFCSFFFFFFFFCFFCFFCFFFFCFFCSFFFFFFFFFSFFFSSFFFFFFCFFFCFFFFPGACVRGGLLQHVRMLGKYVYMYSKYSEKVAFAQEKMFLREE